MFEKLGSLSTGPISSQAAARGKSGNILSGVKNFNYAAPNYAAPMSTIQKVPTINYLFGGMILFGSIILWKILK